MGEVNFVPTEKGGTGKVRTISDLSVNVFSDMIEVETARAPGIEVRLVDRTTARDSLAPEGAVYQIRAYVPREDTKESLNGDVHCVYVGHEGIILGGDGRRRANSSSGVETDAH